MKRQLRALCVAAPVLLLGTSSGSRARDLAHPAPRAGPPLDCEVTNRAVPLGRALRETSGIVRAAGHTSRFWTHNDGGNAPLLYQVDSMGATRAVVRVTGATNVDWEDLAAGPCPDGGRCLLIGDIGDNSGRRRTIAIYRIPEPRPGDSTAAAVLRAARYPAGPRDAEAIFALPTGELGLVTKGRGGAIELYRWPPAGSGGAPVTLQLIRTLLPAPERSVDRVTGASASPRGDWVAVRTYRTLLLYPADQLMDARADPVPRQADLTPVGELQGEGVNIDDDGTVWLTGEGFGTAPATMAALRCRMK